jgi:hypothetical protein
MIQREKDMPYEILPDQRMIVWRTLGEARSCGVSLGHTIGSDAFFHKCVLMVGDLDRECRQSSAERNEVVSSMDDEGITFNLSPNI